MSSEFQCNISILETTHRFGYEEERNTYARIGSAWRFSYNGSITYALYEIVKDIFEWNMLRRRRPSIKILFTVFKPGSWITMYSFIGYSGAGEFKNR